MTLNLAITLLRDGEFLYSNPSQLPFMPPQSYPTPSLQKSQPHIKIYFSNLKLFDILNRTRPLSKESLLLHTEK